MKSDMIHVCYAFYDADGRYSKFAGVSMASIFENTKSRVTIHIIHDNTLTRENREKFVLLTKSYGQYISFYNVDELKSAVVDEMKKSPAKNLYAERFTIGAAYRLFMPDFLLPGIERAIYLDSDTVVNLDIANLWDEDTGNAGIAAIPEGENCYHFTGAYGWMRKSGVVNPEKYFNSAVLLLDFEKILRFAGGNLLMTCLRFLSEHPKCSYPDQDALNYFFSEKYRHLPMKYNRIVVWERGMGKLEKPGIYHYAAYMNGFSLPDIFNEAYLQYFIKTPWCEPEAFGRLMEKFTEAIGEERKKLREITSLLSGRRRILCSDEKNRAPLTSLFHLSAEERFMPLSSEEDFRRVAGDMRTSRGGFLYIFITNSYGAVKDALTRAGFTEGTDFIDGLPLMGPEHGVKIDEFPYVKCM